MLGRKLMFLDYLQQVPTQKAYVNKNNYIESITNKLKVLAIKYGIAIVCLSQLKRTNAEPELTDLRDSGAIEQDADVVMFLHNDDEYTQAIDLLVKKNRHRDKGSTQLTFDKKCFRMF
jgi:replicative DNA helicase